MLKLTSNMLKVTLLYYGYFLVKEEIAGYCYDLCKRLKRYVCTLVFLQAASEGWCSFPAKKGCVYTYSFGAYGDIIA